MHLVHVDDEHEGGGERRRAAVRGQHAEVEAVRRDCGLFGSRRGNRCGKITREHDNSRAVHGDVGVRRQEGEGHLSALRILRRNGRRENERVDRGWVHVENEVCYDGRLVDVCDGDGENLCGGQVVAAQVDGHHTHLELVDLLVVEQSGVLHHHPVRLRDS